MIDTTFDVYSDTQVGRDPDSHSPTLRRYHQRLWSKPLPDGRRLELSAAQPKSYLIHHSNSGEVALSSDSIGHTYRFVKAMAPIIAQVPEAELDSFFATCSTIGAYIVFPSRTIGSQPTINGARGMHPQIRDRFDLTLECIRRHNLGQDSPLATALARYADFFALFGTFEGYIDFFLLQDLVQDKARAVDFFLPFRGFDASALPADRAQYRDYKDQVSIFISARNRRIEAHRAA